MTIPGGTGGGAGAADGRGFAVTGALGAPVTAEAVEAEAEADADALATAVGVALEDGTFVAAAGAGAVIRIERKMPSARHARPATTTVVAMKSGTFDGGLAA